MNINKPSVIITGASSGIDTAMTKTFSAINLLFKAVKKEGRRFKMKRYLLIIVSLMGLFFMMTINAATQVTVQIRLQQAKNIYNAMTGPKIKNEGAAGHLYRTGKSIVCQYINVDMDDPHGNPIPSKDARRYICTIKFNYNGLAMPAI